MATLASRAAFTQSVSDPMCSFSVVTKNTRFDSPGPLWEGAKIALGMLATVEPQPTTIHLFPRFCPIEKLDILTGFGF